MSRQIKPYMADISFLQPVIDAYKLGLFDNMHLRPRILNALDSLSWYGNVKKVTEVSDAPKVSHRKKYTKRSPYWDKMEQPVKEDVS